MSGAITVYAGYNYSLVRKTDNSLWGFGTNSYGQLGDGTMEDRHTPVKVADNVTAAAAGTGYSMTIRTDGSLWACGWNYYGKWGTGTWEDHFSPSMVTTDVVNASASRLICLLVKSDGSLWTYGINQTKPVRMLPLLPVSFTCQEANQ
jgi:alpha-tubulin suppressor-like RCC1 family protein